ncbi:MAG: hypothetical protein ACRBM6_04215 [Geminicoccales bacterium]
MASMDIGGIDLEAVNALTHQLEETLRAAGVDLTGSCSIANYVASFAPLTQLVAYDHIPPDALMLIGRVEATAGSAMVECYHQLVLLTLIRSFEDRAVDMQLPVEIRPHAQDYLARLVGRLAKPRRGHYRLDKDPFLKDLAVARLKLWPAGAELVDIASGIPRRMLMEAGKARFVKALGQIKFQCGGFKPFLETHFDQRASGDFSAEGYRSLYLTIASLLEKAPEMKGMYSCSWWHDPAVVAISPNLGFLNAIAIEGGAKLYPMGTNDQVTAQATRLSSERTQQMRQGNYRPTRYMMVWARKDLLRWAKGQTASATAAVA